MYKLAQQACEAVCVVIVLISRNIFLPSVLISNDLFRPVRAARCWSVITEVPAAFLLKLMLFLKMWVKRTISGVWWCVQVRINCWTETSRQPYEAKSSSDRNPSSGKFSSIFGPNCTSEIICQSNSAAGTDCRCKSNVQEVLMLDYFYSDF